MSNNNVSIFEQASRQKLRFETSAGKLSIEDLWDLPLTSNNNLKINLDSIAKGLHQKLQSEETISFVDKNLKGDQTTQLKFDIVKHIIDVKLEERSKQEQAKLSSDKKQQILALISQKENEKLSEFSIEDLKKMAESL